MTTNQLNWLIGGVWKKLLIKTMKFNQVKQISLKAKAKMINFLKSTLSLSNPISLITSNAESVMETT